MALKPRTSPTSIGSLPPAARRWLDRARPLSGEPPARIIVGQRGEMESGDRWLSFKAEGEYAVQPLSFDWRAKLHIMPAMWVSAKDGHKDGEGWGGAWLWGIKKISARSGPDVLLMQVIRNIAELAWIPELASLDDSLTWLAVGGDAFEIRRHVADREAVVRFDIDADDDIISARSPARPYDVPDGFEMAPWRCDFGDHRDFGGVRIPASVAVTYELEDGPWEYLRAEVLWVTRTTHTI